MSEVGLKTVHIFPSEESYKQHASEVKESDLALTPIELVPVELVKSVNNVFPDDNGNVNVQLGLNESDIKRIVLNTFFPVGSTYISADVNFNPNSWGGTWVKIENRFLLGSGSKGVGAQGGEENVILTQDQMPSHSHTRNSMNITGWLQTTGTSCLKSFGGAFVQSWQNTPATRDWTGDTGYNMSFDASVGWTGSTNLVGGGQAHNNMPPYEVANIWKRTA